MPDRLLILIPLLLLLTACLSLVMSWVWRQISRVAIVAVIGLSLAILLATGLADFGWWSLPGISLIERLPLGWFREADQTVWFWFATSTWSLGLIVVMPNL